MNDDVATLPPPFCRELTQADVTTSATLQSFEAVKPTLSRLASHRSEINTILDVGCHNGGFAKALGTYLEAEQVYGIDRDEAAVAKAKERGVDAVTLDVEEAAFPFESGEIDLVLAFGLVEHLRSYDNVFVESGRVVDDGWLWITAPNLGSWLNRLALLFGYQPRNVELSSERAVGTLPVYDRSEHLDHVHAPTYRALVDVLNLYGFTPIETAGLSPYQRGRLVRFIDWIATHRVSLSRRISILALHDSGHYHPTS